MRRLPLELIERLRALQQKSDTPRDHVGFVATAAGVYFFIAAVIETWRFIVADIVHPIWRFLRTWLMGVVLLMVMVAGPVVAAPFFNSAETGCDGSDANVVMCDDFEDGSWAFTYFDFGANAANDGWLMSVYSPGCGGSGCGSNTSLLVYDAAAPQYARCGGFGAVGTDCAADTGPHGGVGQAYGMGQHILSGVNTSDDASGYTELYIRWYQKFSTGYTFSGQKGMSFLPPTADAGIYIGNVSWAGTPSDEVYGAPYYDSCLADYPACVASFNNPQCRGGSCPSSYYLNQNVGTVFNHGDHLGNWIFTEIRVKLNTLGNRDGIYELWLDDCGATGTSCSGTPTKRASYNNVKWLGPTNGGNPGSGTLTMGRIFHENWANPGPGSSGSLYERNDQYKVSKVGPIGFAGSAPASRGFILRSSMVLLLGLGAVLAYALSRQVVS